MWKQKYQSVHMLYISDKKRWKLYCCIIYKYYLWCVYFFCCNKKTSQHIASVIRYFFSALDFNFSESNMFQKLKYLVLHKLLFWNSASSWKTENFENVSTTQFSMNLLAFCNALKLCCIWQISWISSWKIKISFNKQRTIWNFLNFLRGPVRVCEENPDSRRWKNTQTADYAKAIQFPSDLTEKNSLIIFLIKCENVL